MEIPSGGYLRQWRKTLGLTQAQLAAESGLTQSVIAKVERENVDPRASTLRKMVAALLRSEAPDKPHTVGDIMIEEVAVLAPEDTVQSASSEWFAKASANCQSLPQMEPSWALSPRRVC